ncbi:MAG: DUF2203 domain-containing protein [Phycisphaeraceae bacterium]|nr:DUF2203 domain-containing protein [Phycisphaeraceae bacterium]
MPAEPMPAALPGPTDDDRKIFTLEEANRALAYVGPIVEELATCYEEAVTMRREIEAEGDQADPETVDEYETAMERMNRLVDEIEATGVLLKDFEKGLLDFPAEHEGREVYLCWQLGETEIEAWHEVDGGFAGRKPVAELAVS